MVRTRADKRAAVDAALANRSPSDSLRSIARELEVHVSLVAARAKARPQSGVETYFVFSPLCSLVKIGMSKSNTALRVAKLRGGSPDPDLRLVGIVSKDVEAWCHARFAASRSHGEWFAAREVEPFCDLLFGAGSFGRAVPVTGAIPQNMIVDWNYQGELL